MILGARSKAYSEILEGPGSMPVYTMQRKAIATYAASAHAAGP